MSCDQGIALVDMECLPRTGGYPPRGSLMLRASMPGAITAAPVAQAAVSSNAIHPLQVADWNGTGLLAGYTQLNALTAIASPAPSCNVPVWRIPGSMTPFLFLDGCTIIDNEPSVRIQLGALPALPLPSPPDYWATCQPSYLILFTLSGSGLFGRSTSSCSLNQCHRG
jgi:hypothetical protein